MGMSSVTFPTSMARLLPQNIERWRSELDYARNFFAAMLFLLCIASMIAGIFGDAGTREFVNKNFAMLLIMTPPSTIIAWYMKRDRK